MKKLLSSKLSRNYMITFGIVIVGFIVIQLLIPTGLLSSTFQGLLVNLCYYVILAVSLNLTVGILGELSLGHAGFMCIGAFTSAFFTNAMADSIESDFVRFLIGLVIGTVAAGVFGILIGIPVLRLSGDYLAIVTLAFGQIIVNIFTVLYVGVDSHGIHIALTSDGLGLEESGKIILKGAQGITGTPRVATFVIGIILVLLTLFIVLNFINSRAGRAVMAIRDNKIAAESVGINVSKYKILAFSISAALAGMAGVLYAHNISSLTATTAKFGYTQSIMILVFVVLGGIGSIRGSMIAAIILTLLPEYLRFLQDYRMLIYAIVLIVMMIATWNPTCKAFLAKHSPKNWFKKKKEVE
ncbi:MAG: branched-chain amino acid ABC transporter permease [Parasporobacterium sp.]|nr:branched-chain amino acid ABC transporter permease [Parasporobacterium sp.]